MNHDWSSTAVNLSCSTEFVFSYHAGVTMVAACLFTLIIDMYKKSFISMVISYIDKTEPDLDLACPGLGWMLWMTIGCRLSQGS